MILSGSCISWPSFQGINNRDQSKIDSQGVVLIFCTQGSPQGRSRGSPAPLHLHSATAMAREILQSGKDAAEGREAPLSLLPTHFLGISPEDLYTPFASPFPWSHTGILTPDLTDQKNYLEPSAPSSSDRICEILYSGQCCPVGGLISSCVNKR